MKRGRNLFRIIILLISHFFFLGCGIPSYFYLGSTYYHFNVFQEGYNDVKMSLINEANKKKAEKEKNKNNSTTPSNSTENASDSSDDDSDRDSNDGENPNENESTEVKKPDFIETSVTITFDDPDQMKNAEDCPSAILFYWIDDEETTNSSALSNLQSKFSSKYKKNEPSGGVPLYIYSKDSAEDEPVVEEYTPSSSSSSTAEEETEYDNKKHYRMYYPTIFSFPVGEAKAIEAPKYYSPPNEKTEALYITFKIKQGVNEAYPMYYKKFILEYDDYDSATNPIQRELRRYNNEDFMDEAHLPTPSNFSEFKNANNDYWAIDSLSGITESTVLYVHFVVAFTATKGKYNNIFWSSLYSDSSLTFPLTLDTFIQKPEPETPTTTDGKTNGKKQNEGNSK